MRSNVITIIKKEFMRFFLDKRLLVTTLILPGTLIFIVYSIIGNSISDSTDYENFKPVLYTVNMPASIENAAANLNVYIGAQVDDPETIKPLIKSKECDALIVFPPDFDRLVNEYDPLSGTEAPNVEIYYNSSSKNSESTYYKMSDLLDDYKYMISNKFDVNKGQNIWDLADEKETAGNVTASILPMLLIMFMFSGCMSIAPESIAGEKERGTIATLLVTPVKRSELAAGKILSLGVMALLCGLSTLTGLLLSLSGILGREGVSISVDIYGASDYVALLLVVFSTVILDVTLISILSAFAKSVKEAATIVMPLLFINVLVGMGAIVDMSAKTDFYYYLIPLYSSVQCMKGIFAFNYSFVNVSLSIAANTILSCFGGFILSKMFESEKIIFNK